MLPHQLGDDVLENGRWISERLVEMADHLGHVVGARFVCLQHMMVCPELLRYQVCGRQLIVEAAARKPDAESLNLFRAVPGRKRGNGAGIKASAQEEAERNVTDEP